MKNFKLLFMLAGLSSVVRASDLPEESFFTKANDIVACVTKNASEFGATVSTKASEFGSSVVRTSSDLTSAAVRNTTELADSVAKNVSEFGANVSTMSSDLYAQSAVKTSEMTTASVQFVEDNQQAVIITSVVATALAITAIVRYNIYGYVFYKSEKAADQK